MCARHSSVKYCVQSQTQWAQKFMWKNVSLAVRTWPPISPWLYFRLSLKRLSQPLKCIEMHSSRIIIALGSSGFTNFPERAKCYMVFRSHSLLIESDSHSWFSISNSNVRLRIWNEVINSLTTAASLMRWDFNQLHLAFQNLETLAKVRHQTTNV